MAKKKINTSKLDLSLGKKQTIKKTEPISKMVDSDEVVKKIHDDVVDIPVKASKAPKEATASEPTRRVTLDIPVSLHKQIKIHVFNLETTMKKYFLELAEKDIKG